MNNRRALMTIGFAAMTAICGCDRICKPARENPNDDKRVWTMLNMDCNYYENTYPEAEMTCEAIDKHVAMRIQGGKVTHFFVNPNGQMSGYPSQVSESFWTRNPWVKADFDPMKIAWVRHAKLLADRGIDRYAEQVKAARKYGAEGWISMRMNDLHAVDDHDSFFHSIFWHDNPQFWRYPNALEKNDRDYFHRALDFAHPEVRKWTLDYAYEMLERYDMDGFDVDWTRFGAHLTPHKEQQLAGCLTEVMRAIKKKVTEMEKRRGHRIFISASIGSNPEACLSAGMDAVEWAKEGLIDVLIVGCFWSSIDYDLPYAEWKKRIAAVNKNVRLMVRMDDAVQQGYKWYRFMLDEPSYRGYWDNMMAQGCRDFGYFNLFDPPSGQWKSWRGDVVMNHGITPEFVYNGSPRRYAVTYMDIAGEDFDRRKQLPAKLDKGAKVTLTVGTVKDAEKVTAEVSFLKKPQGEVKVTLNGVAALSSAKEATDIVWYHHGWYKNGGEPFSYRVEFPASAVKAGVNEIKFGAEAGNEVCNTYLVVTPKESKK